VWTKVDGSQAFCGSCHGLPPANHPALAAGSDVTTCAACHPGTVKPTGAIDVAGGKHLNGLADGFAGHPAGWATKGDPAFHGQAALQDASSCMTCHAATAPARVSAVTCASCHDQLAGGDWTKSCNGCHGSTANAAPPKDTKGNVATTARGVGAHQSHATGTRALMRPMDCFYCHRKPTDPFSPGHMNGTVDLTGYTGTDTTMAARIQSQGWDANALTCANYCHGATMGGGTNTRPQWTKVDGTQATCGSCHGLPPPAHPALAAGSTAATCAICHPSTVLPDGSIDVASGRHLNGVNDGFWGHPPGWMDYASTDFHGAYAKDDQKACYVCHAKNPPAYGSAVVCSSCHGAIDSGNWGTSCNGCHGSPTSDAPPKDLQGNVATTFIGVGAHQSHVTGLHGVTAPLDCTSCHPKPSTPIQALHMDGKVEVTGYTGTDLALLAAITTPGWDRTTVSCATSYCHGATLGGGTAMQPVWTKVDGTQAACGSCHGLPPTKHLTLTPPVTAASCAPCHPGTVKADGTIDVAGGKHLNGKIDAEGFEGHGTGWLVPGDPQFHGQVAIQNGLDSCFKCHSAKEPAANGIPSCASCHDALAGGGDWTTSCTGCHGDATTAAPPKDVHGNTATTAIGVGAHRSHTDATHNLARKYGCEACHQKPAVVFAPGHLDGTTVVTGYTGSDANLQNVKEPGWNATSASCSTSWCHGNYSGVFTYYQDDGSGTTVQVDYPYARTGSTPVWNLVDGTQGACGSCHGLPPSGGTWHSGAHGGAYNSCALCHPGVNVDGTAFTDASRHVDGVVDVTPQWTSRCFACH
jgi:predicted CxxxxCH...CXXCH cytochrome family protein